MPPTYACTTDLATSPRVPAPVLGLATIISYLKFLQASFGHLTTDWLPLRAIPCFSVKVLFLKLKSVPVTIHSPWNPQRLPLRTEQTSISWLCSWASGPFCVTVMGLLLQPPCSDAHHSEPPAQMAHPPVLLLITQASAEASCAHIALPKWNGLRGSDSILCI